MVVFLWYETEDACTNTLLLEIMWEFLFKLPDFYSHIKIFLTYTTYEMFNFYLKVKITELWYVLDKFWFDMFSDHLFCLL